MDRFCYGTSPLLKYGLYRGTGSTCVEELVDALLEEDLEVDSSSGELADASSDELVEAPVKAGLEWVGKTSTLGLGGLQVEQILPSRLPLDKSSSAVLMQGVDFVLGICRTWKSFIKLAIVIFHGYETSTSGLRMLGVEEYS